MRRWVVIGLVVLVACASSHQGANSSLKTAKPSSPEQIVHEEYLIELEPGEEANAKEILSSTGMRLIYPLGKWLYVANSTRTQKRVLSRSGTLAARPSEVLRQKLEDHPAIRQAHHNRTLRFLQVKPEFSKESYGCGNLSSDVPGLWLPNDPNVKEEWHLGPKGINAQWAWTLTKGSHKVNLAVIDEGIDLKALDLAGNVACGNRCFEAVWPFGPNRSQTKHGSYVVSVAAGCTNNGIGTAGVDWNAHIQGIELSPDDTLGGSMAAIMWAAGIDICKGKFIKCNSPVPVNPTPADVINISFTHYGMPEADQRLLSDLIALVNAEGAILVFAAGNSGRPHLAVPAAMGGVVSVGASTFDGKLVSSSSWGKGLDVLAPGAQIPTVIESQVHRWEGTSAAAPIVSGAVALMKSVAPTLNWKVAEYILKHTARPLTCEQYCIPRKDGSLTTRCQAECCDEQGNQRCLAGIVDAGAAVEEAQKGIPNVALVDASWYSPLLVKDSFFSDPAPVVVKFFNRGGARAKVKISEVPGLVVNPREFVLEASGKSDGNSKLVKLSWDAWGQMPRGQFQSVDFSLQANDADKPDGYQDSLDLKLYLHKNTWF